MCHSTHGHAHEHGELAAAASTASVAVDIGDGRGALVLYPSERFRGREIEISGVDHDEHRVHTGVHDRSTAAGTVLTAVFGSLPAGDYLVWLDADTPGPVLEVPDGAVAEARLD
jgi:hypothetical protein